ncbi:MAG: hypothetical protein A3F47_00705 [Candidatus Staskawiczbacteria bacterium RIFCSPHIGHO2_12_FULL_38_11]|uniref:Pyridoxamine 5'-phosphate oxidase N-terminal domain-containing protein n=1 Tax=Candidatus Staskawiczbacteria bacterium RIFCSPHIGHO2_12_FULL_38_11 TaxID=1802209 RepID=A0A1G2I782_9BACT|nr:MAG: hypothetical protein A3F47_00705 [Candidatus Staskawiczbacteria bacterium RIFCSPHIGHO2_12_FULL_38_11]
MIKNLNNMTKQKLTKGEINFKALKFLRSQNTMVLASISNNLEPQAATVYFVCDEHFNLFFMTSKDSKKAENLKINGKVAFVIGWGPQVITIQGGGVAKELDKREAETFIDLIKKNDFESANQWPLLKLAKEGYITFKITPLWMTYLNMEKVKHPNIASSEFYKII